MDQTMLSEEAAKNGNNTDLEVKPAIEDDKDYHIASDDHQNGLVAAPHGSLIQLCSAPLEADTLTQMPAGNNRSRREFTALDLRHRKITEEDDGLESSSSASSSPHSESALPKSIKKKKNKRFFPNSSLLLTGSALIAGSTYTSIFNLNHSYPPVTEPFSVRDINRLPNAFYSVVFMTFAFAVSMVGVVVPLWSMIKARSSFSYRALLLLGLASFFTSYIFAMKEILPKFWVTFQSFKISSFWLVWVCVLSIILLLLAIFIVVKLILPTITMSLMLSGLLAFWPPGLFN